MSSKKSKKFSTATSFDKAWEKYWKKAGKTTYELPVDSNEAAQSWSLDV
jgi:hypothetical protein